MQKQAALFASVSSDYDSIPCNQYLVGLVLPWVLAAIVCHLQAYALLLNWVTLSCSWVVSVVCSLLMWTTQIEEAIVHETNFKESIQMLVV
mmetsp:Transcript_34372/g.52658  ORF Transcript_34372/g.52658 Transcript_34372/m.52658 type:complete len:91 (-) Transcript_34372:401-673(-)